MKPDSIVIHHSLTKDSKTVSWDAIRRYHKSLGWNDIGYHFGIELVNGNYEVLMGRMLNEFGAHCKQRQINQRSIGICLVGNFDSKFVPDQQMELLTRLVRSLIELLNINPDNVFPHSFFAKYKSCPGKMFDFPTFLKEIKNGR